MALIGFAAQTQAALLEALASVGHRSEFAEDAEELAGRLAVERLDVLFLALPGDADGVSAAVREVKARFPSSLAVGVGAALDAEAVAAAFRAGAHDIILGHPEAELVRSIADRALELRMRGQERKRVAENLEAERARVAELERRITLGDPFEALVGSSNTIQFLVRALREVARTESTVLITGESGTGKGLAARAIHQASARAHGPFVEAHCVIYSENLLHSELFGHERGAFTGAARQKRGRFELARGGTIFLDEIGDIPQPTQLMLLRVLQNRTFERVGGEDTLETDARLIAATNADLDAAIKAGKFRADLYFRLNVIPITLPPLRDHLEDVPLLASRFLKSVAEKLGREEQEIAPEAMEVLMSFGWPGNIRQLENLVERLAVMARGRIIRVEDLPPEIRTGAEGNAASGTLRQLEASRIAGALRECSGNKKAAAAKLGIHRATLYAKMRRYGLSPEGELTLAAGSPRRPPVGRRELS